MQDWTKQKTIIFPNALPRLAAQANIISIQSRGKCKHLVRNRIDNWTPTDILRRFSQYFRLDIQLQCLDAHSLLLVSKDGHRKTNNGYNDLQTDQTSTPGSSLDLEWENDYGYQHSQWYVIDVCFEKILRWRRPMLHRLIVLLFFFWIIVALATSLRSIQGSRPRRACCFSNASGRQYHGTYIYNTMGPTYYLWDAEDFETEPLWTWVFEHSSGGCKTYGFIWAEDAKATDHLWRCIWAWSMEDKDEPRAYWDIRRTKHPDVEESRIQWYIMRMPRLCLPLDAQWGRWLDQVKQDLSEIGCLHGWEATARYQASWGIIVDRVMSRRRASSWPGQQNRARKITPYLIVFLYKPF